MTSLDETHDAKHTHFTDPTKHSPHDYAQYLAYRYQYDALLCLLEGDVIQWYTAKRQGKGTVLAHAQDIKAQAEVRLREVTVRLDKFEYDLFPTAEILRDDVFSAEFREDLLDEFNRAFGIVPGGEEMRAQIRALHGRVQSLLAKEEALECSRAELLEKNRKIREKNRRLRAEGKAREERLETLTEAMNLIYGGKK